MDSWYNCSEKPLSSSNWLLTHHKAKYEERLEFAKLILKDDYRKIVDLGCGPGHWLQLFDKIAPLNCKLIGIDMDSQSIKEAVTNTIHWSRKKDFITCDFEDESNKIPKADLILAFNIFSYIKNPSQFIENIKLRLNPSGTLVIRQYDGNFLRFGPVSPKLRLNIEKSLHASLSNSNEFKHYALDEVFTAVEQSSFEKKDVYFETFQKVPPYSEKFIEYYKKTIIWTMNYISDDAAQKLQQWYTNFIIRNDGASTYFVEVDLVSLLS